MKEIEPNYQNDRILCEYLNTLVSQAQRGRADALKTLCEEMEITFIESKGGAR